MRTARVTYLVCTLLAGNVPGHCKATEHEAIVYIFAQNIDVKDLAAKGTVQVDGLRAGTKLEVVDEQRTMTAEDGRFSDAFEPLAEHIYRLPRE